MNPGTTSVSDDCDFAIAKVAREIQFHNTPGACQQPENYSEDIRAPPRHVLLGFLYEYKLGVSCTSQPLKMRPQSYHE